MALSKKESGGEGEVLNSVYIVRLPEQADQMHHFLSTTKGMENEKELLSVTKDYPLSTQMILQQILKLHNENRLTHLYSPINEVRVLLAENNGAFSSDSSKIIAFFETVFAEDPKKCEQFISFRKSHLDEKLQKYSEDEQKDIEQQVHAFFEIKG